MSGIAPEPDRCPKCHNTLCMCVGGTWPGPASGSALVDAEVATKPEVIEQLRYLDSLQAHQRWHKFKTISENHLLLLYIVCVNGYGSDSPVGQDLLRAVGKWVDRQRTPRMRKWLQIVNEEAVVKGEA